MRDDLREDLMNDPKNPKVERKLYLIRLSGNFS